MKHEPDPIASITSRYRVEGWTPLSSKEALSVLSFEPDIFLAKGDKRLVVDVKREGFVDTRARDILKSAVESRPNWRFATEIIPATASIKTQDVDIAKVSERLQLAEKLENDGFSSQSVFMIWTAIELMLRSALSLGTTEISSSIVLKKAYEEELITDAERRKLTTFMQMRNRIAHGMEVSDAKESLPELFRLARELENRLSDPSLGLSM